MESPSTKIRKSIRWNRKVAGEARSFRFRRGKFEMLIRHPGGDVRQRWMYELEFEEMLGL